MITIAELQFQHDDTVRRKKAGTITLIFKATDEHTGGEFVLKAIFERTVPSYWQALIGDGDYSEFFARISKSSVQSKLEE